MMAVDRNPQRGVVLTEAQIKARRQRNIAIAIIVALFAALFYAVTIVKLGPGVLQRPS
jgi:capsular polysaccharide biosynthesis protein